MQLSLVIPCRDKEDSKLKELLRSIEAQDFPKEELEILVITEGTSESAKAIGIRRAKGEVIGILASDNELVEKDTLSYAYESVKEFGSVSPLRYFYKSDDDILNRYFSLIGGNDPLSFYMRKNDRFSYFEDYGIPPNNRMRTGLSWGDNGFFTYRHLLLKTDLDNYYHVDNANEIDWIKKYGCQTMSRYIWHKTGGNIFSFFRKRYRYGLQHAFNPNRRWHLVDFSKPKDIVRLTWFIIASITLVNPLYTALRGYLKIQDKAWFLHPVCCLATVITYAILMMHLGLRKMSLLPSAPTVAQKA